MTRTLAMIFAFLMLSVHLLAQTPTPVPPLLNFQGRLATPSGNPVPDGNYTLTFRLFDAGTGGTARWTETLGPIRVKNGVFAVLLGNVSPLSDDIFNQPQSFLEIQNGSDAPLAPRQRLVSVAYAMKANVANTVSDGAITSAKIANGAVTANKLASGVLPTALPPSGAAGGDLAGTYPNPIIKTDPALLAKVSGTLMTAMGASGGANQSQELAPLTVTDQGWQSFTPSVSGQITGIEIWVGTTGASPSTNLILYAGEGTNGTELGRRSVTVRPTLGWQAFDLQVPINVTAGQKYTWYFGPRATLILGYSPSNPYSSGISDLGATLDYAFRVYMTTPDAGIRVATNLNVTGAATFNQSLNVTGNTLVNGLLNVNGNVGLGVAAPAAKLDVSGSIFTTGFKLSTAAGNGYLLTSDASGVGTWKPLSLAEIAAGGDLTGNYPNPTIKANAVTTAKIADGNITTAKLADSSVTNVKIQNVDWSKLLNVPPALLTLPYSGSANTSGNAFAVTNSNGTALYGKGRFAVYGEGGQYGGFFQSDTNNYGYAVYGQNTASGDFGAFGVASIPVTAGVYGNSSGNGFGVLGRSVNGLGVAGESVTDVGIAGTSVNNFGVYGRSNNNYAGYFNGNVFANNYASASDERYKANINPLENSLAAILNMRGVSYEWKRDEYKDMNFGKGRQIGFIAQELEKVLPELVYTDSKGYKSVNYSHVVPVLVEAMKTQQKQIDELKAQVALLAAVAQAEQAKNKNVSK